MKQAEAKPLIGDSPSIESLDRAATIAGIKEIAQRNGAELLNFRNSIPVSLPSKATFKRLEISQEVLSADCIINLPKLKTHGQMLLTLAIKNLFGCVVGKRKAQWHLQVGSDIDKFAELLVEIYQVIQPKLTIVDGIVAMEGNGPGSGSLRALGLIILGNNCLAIDMIITRLLGLHYRRLHTNRAALRKGLQPSSLDEIEIVGDSLEEHIIENFLLPPPSSNLTWNIPDFASQRLKRYLGTFPKIDRSKCTLCRICEEVCPAKAIREVNGIMNTDYNKCISCFCCQENCPQGAIGIKQGWLLRLFS